MTNETPDNQTLEDAKAAWAEQSADIARDREQAQPRKDLVEWLREKCVAAEKELRAREQMAESCEQSADPKFWEALAHRRIAEKLRHELTMFRAALARDRKATANLMSKPTNGVELIAAERERQTPGENIDAGELIEGAIAYAVAAHDQVTGATIPDHPPYTWPWADEEWHPGADAVANLVKAGALIAAEIDRLLRKGTTP